MRSIPSSRAPRASAVLAAAALGGLAACSYLTDIVVANTTSSTIIVRWAARECASSEPPQEAHASRLRRGWLDRKPVWSDMPRARYQFRAASCVYTVRLPAASAVRVAEGVNFNASSESDLEDLPLWLELDDGRDHLHLEPRELAERLDQDDISLAVWRWPSD